MKVWPVVMEAIQLFLYPMKLRALRCFVGMIIFYTRFILKFLKKVVTLHGLKKYVRFVLEGENQVAFSLMNTAHVLQILDCEKEFMLVTGMSDWTVSSTALELQW